jgi:hypothetical protein
MRKIGFTGTQVGMSRKQAMALTVYLTGLKDGGIEFHHGDCIGADAQAYKIARNAGCRTVCHPPINGVKRANTSPNDETRAPKDYRDRNMDIVLETEYVVATPKEFHEAQRSGTWSTIRDARRKGKTAVVIWPDGDVDTFSGVYDKKIKMAQEE